jgi:hypothetical protein
MPSLPGEETGALQSALDCFVRRYQFAPVAHPVLETDRALYLAHLGPVPDGVDTARVPPRPGILGFSQTMCGLVRELRTSNAGRVSEP